jgi:hypothetical protein
MYILCFMQTEWDHEGTPTVYVPPFSISLLFQPDDGPLVGFKHVALVKTF